MLGGLAAIAAMAFGTSTAGAATISPQGPFTGTSGGVTFKFWGFWPVTCTSSTITGTVNAPSGGASSISGGKPSFSNCSLPQGVSGPVEVTATKPVSYEMTHLGSGVQTLVSNISLDFYWPRTLCRVNVQGTATAENPGLGPVTISQLSPSASGTAPPYQMRASLYAGNSGTPCKQWIYTGQPVGIEATYKLDHPLTVSN